MKIDNPANMYALRTDSSTVKKPKWHKMAQHCLMFKNNLHWPEQNNNRERRMTEYYVTPLKGWSQAEWNAWKKKAVWVFTDTWWRLWFAKIQSWSKTCFDPNINWPKYKSTVKGHAKISQQQTPKRHNPGGIPTQWSQPQSPVLNVWMCRLDQISWFLAEICLQSFIIYQSWQKHDQ